MIKRQREIIEFDIIDFRLVYRPLLFITTAGERNLYVTVIIIPNNFHWLTVMRRLIDLANLEGGWSSASTRVLVAST